MRLQLTKLLSAFRIVVWRVRRNAAWWKLTHDPDGIYSPQFNAAMWAEYVKIRDFSWGDVDTKELEKFMKHIQERAFWEGREYQKRRCV